MQSNQSKRKAVLWMNASRVCVDLLFLLLLQSISSEEVSIPLHLISAHLFHVRRCYSACWQRWCRWDRSLCVDRSESCNRRSSGSIDTGWPYTCRRATTPSSYCTRAKSRRSLCGAGEIRPTNQYLPAWKSTRKRSCNCSIRVAAVAFVAEAVFGTGDGGVVFAFFCFALSDVLSDQCCGSLLISMNHDLNPTIKYELIISDTE